MNIKEVFEGEKVTLYLSGVIDIHSAEELKKSLSHISDKDAKEVILDFEQVGSIGSSGIGALIRSHKEFVAKGKKFRVVNLNKEITALFKIIKLDKLLAYQGTSS
jgi:anti-sigma B factor antagonist